MTGDRLVPLLLLAAAAAGAGESLPPLAGGRSPQNLEALWAGYDPAAEPLEAKTIRQWREGPAVCRYVVFTIGTFKGRRSRLAGYYAFPAGRAGRVPGLLHLHGGGQRASLTNVVFAASNGYAALSINWGGKPMEDARPGEPNTDWGAVDATQTGHNSHYASLKPDAKTLDAVESPRNNNWYLLVLAGRRAITFLQQQAEVDPERIGVHGHSMGGKLTVNLAGADRRVRAAVPSCGGAGSAPDRVSGMPGSGLRSKAGLYLRTIDDRAYIPRVTCPVLYLSPTNDFNGPLDCMFENWRRIGSTDVRYAISPHLNHRHEREFSVTRYLWFDRHLRGGPALPKTPVLELKLDGPDGVPRAVLRPDRPGEVVRACIYYAVDPHVLTRFWRDARARREGEAWTGTCPIPATDRPLFAVANVYYPLRRSFSKHKWLSFDGVGEFAVSSRMVTVLPTALKKAGVQATDSRSLLVEDFSRGWHDWYRLAWPNPVHWQAVTRKPKDPTYRGPDGARLALDVKSPTDNVLVFAFTFNNWGAFPGKPGGTYAAVRKLKASADWQTVTVGLDDLVPAGKSNGKARRPASWRYLTELGLCCRATLWRGAAAEVVEHRWKGPREFCDLRWQPEAANP